MKRYSAPIGRVGELKHEHPERTAYRRGISWDSETEFQVWTNRAAMARSIRIQESNPTHSGLQWRAVVPLTPGEGY